MMYVSTISAASISIPLSQRRSSSAAQRVIRSSVSIRRRFVRRTASSSSIRTGGVSHPLYSKAGLIGLLRAKKALVFNTSNTSAQREDEVFGDPLERLWRDCIFDFCGVKDFDRVMFRIVADSSADERSAWLEEAADRARRAFPSP